MESIKLNRLANSNHNSTASSKFLNVVLMITSCFLVSGCSSQFEMAKVEDLNVIEKAPVAPSIESFTSDALSITAGQSTTLRFSVEGADMIRINPGNISVTNATSLSVTPSVTTTYTLVATNTAGSKTRTVTVTVTPVVAMPVISSFTTSAATVTAGGSVTLNFSVTGATSLKLDPGSINVTGTSSRLVSPSATTTYTLTAVNSAGSVTSNVSVAVTPVVGGGGGIDINTNCTLPLTLSARGKVKFQPGHYVALGADKDGTKLVTTLNEIQSIPGIIGVQKRYYWSDLQGANRNDFDFTDLTNDIAKVKAKGKKLSVMIMWKFRTDSGSNPVPSFLGPLSPGQAYQYKLNAAGKSAIGYIAYLGNSIVVNELSRFLRKLAIAIDEDNTVSSIVFAESAMGLKADKMEPPMSATTFKNLQNGHVNGLLEVNRQATCAFKHTPVIQLTNTPLRRMDEITDEYLKWSIGMGGPDVWVNDAGIEKVYEFYPKVLNKLPIGLIIAGGNYLFESHEPETLPASERDPFLLSGAPYFWNEQETVKNLGKKAIDTLGANYIFWKKNGNLGDKYWAAFKQEIVKLGSASQTIKPTIKTCPSKYGSICVENLAAP